MTLREAKVEIIKVSAFCLRGKYDYWSMGSWRSALGWTVSTILMVGNQPAGGRWNFDRENRKPPKGKLTIPEALWFEPDAITTDVINLLHLEAFKSSHDYWQVQPFYWGVTRQQALQVL